MSVAAPETPVAAALEKAAKAAAEVTAAMAAVTEAADPKSRDELITLMEAERDDFRSWMTLVYQSAVDYQAGSHRMRNGSQVCLAGFNKWLGRCGLPQPADLNYGIPARDAKITVAGDNEIPLSYLTVAGLAARRAAWHAAWEKQRQQVRQQIIKGVEAAHGNFDTRYRDDALKILGLEPVQRVAHVGVYVNLGFDVRKTRVSDAQIREKIVATLQEIVGEGAVERGSIADYVNVEHFFRDEA